MYRVILVEDEEFVRDAIRDIIDWNRLGFELVGEAGDGQEALEMLEKTQPDLILTDICMPFMDGLELAERAKEIIPTVKIVIITGYDEFEYAQQAVQLNVSNYILKPITASEFSQTLEKLKKELDEEFARKRDIERLREQLQENLEMLRERFFINLVSNKMSKQEINEGIKKLGLDLTAQSYIVSVMVIDNMNEVIEIFGNEDKQLIDFAILNISKEVLEKYKQYYIFSDRDQQFTLIFLNNDPEVGHFKHHAIRMLKEIIFSLKKFMNIGMTAGVGDEYDTLEKVRYSYQDALTAIEYRVLMGKEKVIVKSDVERKPSFVYQKVIELLECLRYKIKLGTEGEINSQIDNIFEIMEQSQISLSDFRTILLELTVTILRAYGDISANLSNGPILDFNLFEKLVNMNDLNEIKDYFRELCRRLSKNISKLRDDDFAIQVEKAKAFIEENYHRSDLNIQSLCDYLYLSPSYFSKIFKNGTGETFVEHLTRIRMEKAKELLKSTALKTYEIAQKVGYEDPHYFSYNFKRKTGLTPTEFRRK